MEAESNWKPETIKLETEFIVDENDGDEESIGHYQDSVSPVQAASVPDGSLVIFGGSDVSSENNFSLSNGCISSTSDVPDVMVEVKVEYSDDEEPTTDQFQSAEWNSSVVHTSECSPGGTKLESDDDLVEGEIHGDGCGASSAVVPFSVFQVSPELSDGTKYKSQDNVEGNLCIEETPPPEFESVNVKMEIDIDDGEPAPPKESGSRVITKNGRRAIIGCLIKRMNPEYSASQGKEIVPAEQRKAMKPASKRKKSLEPRVDAKPFTCDQCPARYKWKSTLDLHLLTHSSKNRFSCEHCTERFKTKALLKAHSPAQCRDKTFHCEECSKRFATSNHLLQHVWRRHTNERPFSCTHCSADFKSKHELKLHIVIHSDERPFACDQCSLGFKRKNDLKEHLRCHTNERPISCKQCSAQFKAKRDLRLHLIYHSDEKRFACDQCPARYRLKSELEEHSNSHSGEKPFCCTMCPSRFARRSSLRKHSTTHSDARPFVCDFCPAAFKRRYTLRDHLRTHADKRNDQTKNGEALKEKMASAKSK